MIIDPGPTQLFSGTKQVQNLLRVEQQADFLRDVHGARGRALRRLRRFVGNLSNLAQENRRLHFLSLITLVLRDVAERKNRGDCRTHKENLLHGREP